MGTITRPSKLRAARTPLEEPAAGHRALPDFQHIKARIPVEVVARDLGLEVTSSYRARCWRVENHRNHDADPSISFQKSKNRWRCWICDPRSLSNLDLVMMVNGMTVGEAAQWIASRYSVPPAPKGRHLGPPKEHGLRYRVGVSGSPVLDTLVRSGFWGELDDMERRIIPVMLAFADPEAGLTTMSYAAIMRYTSIGSRKTITKWTKSLERRHLLEITRGRDEALRACNAYRVSVDDPALQETLSMMHRRQQAQVEFEKAARAAGKRARRAARTNFLVPAKGNQQIGTQSKKRRSLPV